MKCLAYLDRPKILLLRSIGSLPLAVMGNILSPFSFIPYGYDNSGAVPKSGFNVACYGTNGLAC